MKVYKLYSFSFLIITIAFLLVSLITSVFIIVFRNSIHMWILCLCIFIFASIMSMFSLILLKKNKITIGKDKIKILWYEVLFENINSFRFTEFCNKYFIIIELKDGTIFKKDISYTCLNKKNARRKLMEIKEELEKQL